MHHWHKQKICKDKVYHVIKLKLMLGVLKYDYVVLVQMSPLQILRLSTNTISQCRQEESKLCRTSEIAGF